jgi:PQQ-dependent catabolism-associated CXXCW motif protein
MIRGLAVAAFLGLADLAPVAAQDAAPAEPDSFRVDNYRAPTPTGLRGATTITTAEAAGLWRSGTAVFIDVLPRPPRPSNLPKGTIWHEKIRRDIPGSVWLPDTGYGELSQGGEHYLKSGLDRATQANGDKALVFYCQQNCWMSWNAAKRALAWHYAHVVWYPEGTDGWSNAGLPLTEAQPIAQDSE